MMSTKKLTRFVGIMAYFKRELLSYFSPISICCIYLLLSDIVSICNFLQSLQYIPVKH